MEQMPDDLKQAYETFTLLCTQKGYTFAGMVLCLEPVSMYAVGNVKERGHDLASLFRLWADIVDRKTDAGQIMVPEIPTEKLN
jgi:hypothetical protein